MLVVVTSPLYPITLAGWLLFGLGLSGILPRVYTAAGYLGRADSGRTLSHVVSFGYVGLLAGPAVIGWLGGMVGLTLALLVPLAFCAAGLFLAPQVAVAKPKPEEEEAAPAGTSGSGGRH
jgi:MFS family permease